MSIPHILLLFAGVAVAWTGFVVLDEGSAEPPGLVILLVGLVMIGSALHWGIG